MEEALTALLVGATSAGGNVGWNRRPQASPTPAICLHRKAGRDDVTYGGATGLVDSRVQVDCWGETYAAARQLGREAKTLLRTFRTAPVQGVFVLTDTDPADDDGNSGQTPDTNLFRTRLDLRVRHIEP